MDISIIIPSYNGKHLLDTSLPYLNDSIFHTLSCETILVDNGSEDDTKKLITKKYIRLDKNYGFTRAVNEGAKKAQGKYLLILNNDCFVEKDTITKLYNFLEKDHGLVATQPIIYTKQGAVENIGYVVDLKKGKATPITDDLRIKKEELRMDKRHDMWKLGMVYGLSATCLLVRKDIFEEIGMFDESFHSYLEDVDLFIRLASKEYKYIPCLEASASHAHMETSKNMGVYKQIHDFINWINIIIKDYPRSFMFRHSLSLIVERLRNLSGLIKAYLS